MMRLQIGTVLLLSFLSYSSALMCYRMTDYNDGSEKAWTVTDQNKICTAQFRDNGDTTFSGVRRLSPYFGGKLGCIEIKAEVVFGMGSDPFWACACMEDLCNKPISFEQFKNQGFSLRSH